MTRSNLLSIIEADERRPSRQLAELLANCLAIPAEEQLRFVDAAGGVRRVSRLGVPQPGAKGQTWPANPPAQLV